MSADVRLNRNSTPTTLCAPRALRGEVYADRRGPPYARPKSPTGGPPSRRGPGDQTPRNAPKCPKMRHIFIPPLPFAGEGWGEGEKTQTHHAPPYQHPANRLHPSSPCTREPQKPQLPTRPRAEPFTKPRPLSFRTQRSEVRNLESLLQEQALQLDLRRDTTA